MKVSGHWIDEPATQAVCKMLHGAGFQVLFVGGCVRNSLLGEPVGDIDIATDAVPEQVIASAQAAGLKPVPTGIEHGTITVVSDHIPHEITTFRKDIASFGRHAKVAFAQDIAQDASRRDFTMNALYARSDGTVIDPLGGIDDLKARRVRFIGDANQRIREDYLRILRFFRFHAWYGDPLGGLNAEGLAAVAEHADGLQNLSRERVSAEMLKLLSAPDPAPSVAAMRSAGVLQQVLPGAEDALLAPLIHLEAEAGTSANSIRRLACIAGPAAAEHLRLSKVQVRDLDLFHANMSDAKDARELGYFHGVDAGLSVLLLRAAMLGGPLDSSCHDDLLKGASAKMPVQAADLMPAYSGRALGRRLKEIEQRWISSGFTLKKQDLV